MCGIVNNRVDGKPNGIKLIMPIGRPPLVDTDGILRYSKDLLGIWPSFDESVRLVKVHDGRYFRARKANALIKGNSCLDSCRTLMLSGILVELLKDDLLLDLSWYVLDGLGFASM